MVHRIGVVYTQPAASSKIFVVYIVVFKTLKIYTGKSLINKVPVRQGDFKKTVHFQLKPRLGHLTSFKLKILPYYYS
jgi:hypothetical protein